MDFLDTAKLESVISTQYSEEEKRCVCLINDTDGLCYGGPNSNSLWVLNFNFNFNFLNYPSSSSSPERTEASTLMFDIIDREEKETNPKSKIGEEETETDITGHKNKTLAVVK